MTPVSVRPVQVKYWISPRGEIVNVPTGKSHRDLCPVKTQVGVQLQLKAGWVRVFEDSLELDDRFEESKAFMTGFCLVKSIWEGNGKPKGFDVFVLFTSGRKMNIDFSEYDCY